MMYHAFRTLIARKAIRRTVCPNRRPRLEVLEDRATPATFTVDDDGAQAPGGGDFTSIQAAVNAADAGDRIRVYPGTYVEQVTITSELNNLKLSAVGAPDQVVIAPTVFTADKTEAIVHVSGATGVQIDGFLISGASAPAGAGAGANYGVLVDNGGSASVTDNHIVAIGDVPLSGIQEGIGVQFGFTDSMGTVLSSGSGSATRNVIEDYQKGGVVVIGAASDADVDHNTIRGVGPTAVIAQNGIQVSDGATADVTHNSVTGNVYTGKEVVATGILLFETADVRVRHNSVFANDEGILLFFADDSEVSHNTVTGNDFNGIGLFEADNNVVTHNVSSSNARDGINVDTSTGNRIEHNRANSNGMRGIALEMTATGNTVRFNQLHNNAGGDLFVGNPDNIVDHNQTGKGSSPRAAGPGLKAGK